MLILLGIVTVFPAYAGVILTSWHIPLPCQRLSRVCGGDPKGGTVEVERQWSFPRMRG